MSVDPRGAGWRRWLREPLGHFLLIGAALFAAYSWLAPADPVGERIVVTQAGADELARQFAARWARPPTEQELAGLIESWVRDEVFYREGLTLGLDRDDPVIKRRVRQKLEVMSMVSVPCKTTMGKPCLADSWISWQISSRSLSSMYSESLAMSDFTRMSV